MATQVASLFALLDLRDQATPKLGGFRANLNQVGADITRVGAGLVGLFGPAAAGFTAATNSALEFDASIANIASVLGLTTQESENLKDQLLEIGGNTVAGPQAVATAFYDIVGGVADASTHMAILDAAIRTSEAGQADLTATTSALISVMNTYSLGAEEATNVSDILTRTVGMGVGTMDEFAAALPTVTGLANNLALGFGDVGWMAAFLTTKGATASEATTQLSGVMTAFLNPNAQMTSALQELGFTSGQAAVQQLGLVGALNAVQGTSTASTEGIASILGRVEALRGALALTGDGAEEFRETFRGSMMGATEAARAIQMESASQQVERLKSQVSELGIRIGTAMLPALQDIMTRITPVVDDVIRWVEANPELVSQIGIIAIVGAGLGLVMIPLGLIISGVGTVVGVLRGALALLLSPVVLLAVAFAGLMAAIHFGYPGGFPQLLSDAATSAQQLTQLGMLGLITALNEASIKAREFIASIDPQAVAGIVIGIGLIGGVLAVVRLATTFQAIAAGVRAAGVAFGLLHIAISPLTLILLTIGLITAAYATNFLGIRDRINELGQTLTRIASEIAKWWRGVITTIETAIQKLREFLGLRTQYTGEQGPINMAPLYGSARDLFGPSAGGWGAGRAAGGPVMAGGAYMVGERGPEMFRPSSSGSIVPNNDLAGAGGPNITIGAIYANDEAGGRAAGRGFYDEVMELWRSRGNT